MFDINLVPEIQKHKQQQAKRNTLATISGIFIVGVLVLALVIVGSLKVAANIRLSGTKENIETVRAESEKYAELEKTVVSLENGLAAIKQTMDGNNNWTILFPHLEAATPNDVSYRSLTIEGATITATLAGSNVDSVARFLESYENYQVVVLSGNGTPQNEVKFSLNSQELGPIKVKSDGSWVYALKATTDEDFVITVSGAVTDKVTYNKATKELKSESSQITTGTASLFTNLVTKQYTKDGSGVNFSATFDVATGVLW